MASEIHVDDIGTKFSITIKDGDEIVDISNATSIVLTFKRPDDELIYRSGVFTTDGTDGKVYYDIVSGDLDEAGYYKLQGKVSSPSGVFHTNIHSFQVHCNL